MPGNVTTYTPTAVFPQLFSRMAAAREWAVQENDYADGTNQRRYLPDGSPSTGRRRFTATLTLDATAMAALIDFYSDQQGGLIPFFFYYPWETVPKFSHDPTGTETDGRYIVRFARSLEVEWRIPRGTVSVELLEVT